MLDLWQVNLLDRDLERPIVMERLHLVGHGGWLVSLVRSIVHLGGSALFSTFS